MNPDPPALASALQNLGPHLLGRKPSPPDSRDYRLGDYLHLAAGAPPDLASALAALEADPHVARATKDWAAFVTPYLQQVPAPPPAPAAPQDVTWADPESVLDQGQYGTCVGNGWAQWGNTLPTDDRFVEADARKVYYEATVIDGSPDDPDAPGGGQQGSTVRSGAKAMQNRGRLSAYAFAANLDEVRAWLDGHGPVVFGTDWHQGMFTPDAGGYVAPTGDIAGGHCYLCIGDLPEEGALLFLNSWSAGWGLAGKFLIRWGDVAQLLAAGGEACAAVEVPL